MTAGERDDERFQAVLRDPEIVDIDVERALRGEDIDHDGRPDDFQGPGRFARRPDGAAVLTR